MKKLIGVIFIVLLFSCSENPKPDVVQPRPQLEVKDSNIVKNEMANPFAPVDVSPMDLSYFPVDYPVSKMSGKITELPVARVLYSRPHRQGRNIFGGLLKYGEPWRLGANEATEIEFFKAVTIQNKKVEKGKYILYCIPQKDKWTVVFNSNLFTWGLKPDADKDLFKFDIPVSSSDVLIEYFTIVFEKNSNGADLIMAWENVTGRLPIQF